MRAAPPSRQHREFAPQRVNLRKRLGLGAASLDHDVGDGATLGLARLVVDARAGVTLSHAAQLDHAGDARLDGSLRRDFEAPVAASPLRLGQQRDLVNENAGAGFAGGVDAGVEQPLHLGVHDRVEVSERRGVAKHNRAECRSVEFAGRGEQFAAEALSDPCEPRRSGRDGIARELVCVNAHRAEFFEPAPDH